MKSIGVFTGIILGLICLLVGGARIHTAAMKRATRYNAYLTMKKAYEHFSKYGVITNPSPTDAQVFPYTNRFSIKGTNYHCVIGMKWTPLSSTDVVMAATKSGSVIYFDGQKAPRLIDLDRKSP